MKERRMKKITIGFLAHVDAGKTTLVESILKHTGKIKNLGRVDNGTAFLDTYSMEKKRGITIYSKPAGFNYKDIEFTVIDTPGHVDFTAETERALSVLDYCVLLISSSDGITAHTRTLFNLLQEYNIPCFIFVNKMDMAVRSKEEILEELNENLSAGFIDMTASDEDIYDEAALLSEEALNYFLETGAIPVACLKELIHNREMFPVYFGSALKEMGIDLFLDSISGLIKEREYPEEFGALAYKISRDKEKRLTFVKITGGKIAVKDLISDDEKINEIRKYDGAKFEILKEAVAGDIIALIGPSKTYAGQGFGYMLDKSEIKIKPVLKYILNLPNEIKARDFFPELKELEEEEPLLSLYWNEENETIEVCIMGEIQLQILKAVISDRFNIDVSFGDGKVLYKETIVNPTYGCGHYEPLKHYAEVHVLIEPLKRGSGVVLSNDVTTDELSINYQKNILSNLSNTCLRGVLIDAPLTDVKITVCAGRSHKKHTESQDMREAVLRAVRQGLMKTESVILEPFFSFVINLPQSAAGRALTDIELFNGTAVIENQDKDIVTIVGRAPVSKIGNYQGELNTYTHGAGLISFKFDGYDICKDQDKVVEEFDYDPDSDMLDSAGSVFVDHGAAMFVPWYISDEYMHIYPRLEKYFDLPCDEDNMGHESSKVIPLTERLEAIGTDEIDDILNSINRNKKNDPFENKNHFKRQSAMLEFKRSAVKKKNAKYLLIDGYNIIHAWPELKELTEDNMDGARAKLLDMICNYQAIKNEEIIVVFDAYKVKGHFTDVMDYHNIHVVYTKEAETADQYIAKFTDQNKDSYDIRVATSDGLIQLIIFGSGATRVSANEFYHDVMETTKEFSRQFTNVHSAVLKDGIEMSEEIISKIKEKTDGTQ